MAIVETCADWGPQLAGLDELAHTSCIQAAQVHSCCKLRRKISCAADKSYPAGADSSAAYASSSSQDPLNTLASTVSTTHPVYHAVILLQIILQRVACECQAGPRPDLSHCPVRLAGRVLDGMGLVSNND